MTDFANVLYFDDPTKPVPTFNQNQFGFNSGGPLRKDQTFFFFSVVALICYHASMTKEVTLRQAGGSVSATLPKDMADRLRLEAGDRILAVETDRGILLTPYDRETERALKVAGKAAKKYRNALRALAK